MSALSERVTALACWIGFALLCFALLAASCLMMLLALLLLSTPCFLLQSVSQSVRPFRFFPCWVLRLSVCLGRDATHVWAIFFYRSYLASSSLHRSPVRSSSMCPGRPRRTDTPPPRTLNSSPKRERQRCIIHNHGTGLHSASCTPTARCCE